MQKCKRSVNCLLVLPKSLPLIANNTKYKTSPATQNRTSQVINFKKLFDVYY